MTWPAPPTTLAISLNDLVFYGFVFVFVAGPWLVKTLKQSGSQQKRPQSTSPTGTAPVPPGAKRSAMSRRQQLEELARQRRTAISGPSTRTEPSNLTMSQRTQRARAQAAYQQRAKQLNQPPQAVQAARSMATSNHQPSIQRKKLLRHKAGRIRDIDLQLTEPAMGAVQRHVPDAPGPDVQRKHASLGPINVRRLRDAIVLKEILDRPLALRDPWGA